MLDKEFDKYKELYDKLPWYEKAYGRIYHFVIYRVFILTGWLPKWMKEIFKGLPR